MPDLTTGGVDEAVLLGTVLEGLGSDVVSDPVDALSLEVVVFDLSP